MDCSDDDAPPAVAEMRRRAKSAQNSNSSYTTPPFAPTVNMSSVPSLTSSSRRYDNNNSGGGTAYNAAGGLSTPPMVIVRGLSSNAGGNRHNRTLSEQDMYGGFDSPLLGERNGLLPLTEHSTPHHNGITGAGNITIPDALGSSSRSLSNMNLPMIPVFSPSPQHSTHHHSHQNRVEFDDDAPPGVSFHPPPPASSSAAVRSHHHLFQTIDTDDNDAPPFALKLSSPPVAAAGASSSKMDGPLLGSKPAWGAGDVGLPDIGPYSPGPFDGLQNATTSQQINVSREALLTGVNFPVMFQHQQMTSVNTSTSVRTSHAPAQKSSASSTHASQPLQQPKGVGAAGGGRDDLPPSNMAAFNHGGSLNDSENNMDVASGGGGGMFSMDGGEEGEVVDFLSFEPPQDHLQPPAPPEDDFPLGCEVELIDIVQAKIAQSDCYWEEPVMNALFAVNRRKVHVIRHSGDYTLIRCPDPFVQTLHRLEAEERMRKGWYTLPKISTSAASPSLTDSTHMPITFPSSMPSASSTHSGSSAHSTPRFATTPHVGTSPRSSTPQNNEDDDAPYVSITLTVHRACLREPKVRMGRFDLLAVAQVGEDMGVAGMYGGGASSATPPSALKHKNNNNHPQYRTNGQYLTARGGGAGGYGDVPSHHSMDDDSNVSSTSTEVGDDDISTNHHNFTLDAATKALPSAFVTGESLLEFHTGMAVGDRAPSSGGASTELNDQSRPLSPLPIFNPVLPPTGESPVEGNGDTLVKLVTTGGSSPETGSTSQSFYRGTTPTHIINGAESIPSIQVLHPHHRTSASHRSRSVRLCEKGNAACAAGRLSDAVDYFTRALEGSQVENPVRLLSNRSAAYLGLKDVKKAMADARSAIKLDATHYLGYMRAGNVLRHLQCHDVASRFYNQALRLDPANKSILDIVTSHKLHMQFASKLGKNPLVTISPFSASNSLSAADVARKMRTANTNSSGVSRTTNASNTDSHHLPQQQRAYQNICAFDGVSNIPGRVMLRTKKDVQPGTVVFSEEPRAVVPMYNSPEEAIAGRRLSCAHCMRSLVRASVIIEAVDEVARRSSENGGSTKFASSPRTAATATTISPKHSLSSTNNSAAFSDPVEHQDAKTIAIRMTKALLPHALGKEQRSSVSVSGTSGGGGVHASASLHAGSSSSNTPGVAVFLAAASDSSIRKKSCSSAVSSGASCTDATISSSVVSCEGCDEQYCSTACKMKAAESHWIMCAGQGKIGRGFAAARALIGEYWGLFDACEVALDRPPNPAPSQATLCVAAADLTIKLIGTFLASGQRTQDAIESFACFPSASLHDAVPGNISPSTTPPRHHHHHGGDTPALHYLQPHHHSRDSNSVNHTSHHHSIIHTTAARSPPTTAEQMWRVVDEVLRPAFAIIQQIAPVDVTDHLSWNFVVKLYQHVVVSSIHRRCTPWSSLIAAINTNMEMAVSAHKYTNALVLDIIESVRDLEAEVSVALPGTNTFCLAFGDLCAASASFNIVHSNPPGGAITYNSVILGLSTTSIGDTDDNTVSPALIDTTVPSVENMLHIMAIATSFIQKGEAVHAVFHR